MQVFKRKSYNKLLEWKQRSNGRSAILIEGARRVGKSTLVTEFAKQEYKSCIVIDFNNVTNEVLTWFDGLVDLDYFFLRLQTYFKVSLHVRQSVIVFDEVQKCPKARQARLLCF